MIRIIFTLFLLFIQLNGQNAFFENQVTFNVPDEWKETDSKIHGEVVNKHYQIKIIKTTQGNVNAFSFIDIFKINKLIPPDEPDRIVNELNRPFGLLLIHGIKESSEWKTFLSSGRNGKVQHIALSRIGTKDNFLIHFWLGFAFEIPENESLNEDAKILMVDTLAAWNEPYSGVIVPSKEIMNYINDFNSVCKSIKINGKNDFSAKFILAPVNKKKNPKFYRQMD